MRGTCQQPGCERAEHCRGWCNTHYWRMRHGKDMDAPNPSDYGLAMGGLVRGPGSMTSDSVPAMLSNGEFVIRAAAVSKYGADLMHAINAGRFASGGPVGYRTTTTANPTAGSGGSVVTSTVPVIFDGRPPTTPD